ncbi:MAG TPA: OmpA family protein, partial [Thermoanaerobaculia bacterium]
QQAAIAEAQKRRDESERQAEELRRQAMLAQQAAEQSAADLEKARAQTAETQAELQRTREQLASREADARRLALEAELARIASTRRDARGFIITLPGIFFDTGKAQLKSGSRATLTRIATQLKTDETLQLTVEGHTDSVGSESSNETLSTARANAVRDFLISQGVPAERLTAVGRGESQPIATNDTAAGRQQNRRVEIVLAR